MMIVWTSSCRNLTLPRPFRDEEGKDPLRERREAWEFGLAHEFPKCCHLHFVPSFFPRPYILSGIR